METKQSIDNSDIFLDDILSHHEPVLLDTSAIGPGDLFGHMISHETYESLDTEVLETELKAQELFLGVLANARVLTIPEVTKEIYHIFLRIKNKKEYFDCQSHLFKKTSSGRGSSLAKNRETLESIIYNFKKMQELSSISEIDIKDNNYQTMVKMIKKTQELFNIKKNNNIKYGRDDNIWAKDTDEKLVAMFYWICLNSQDSENNPGIVSGDWDILNLIGASYDVFLSYNLCPYNTEFRDFLLKTNPAVYIADNEKIGWTKKFSLKTAKEEVVKKYNSIKRTNRKSLIKELEPLFKNLDEYHQILRICTPS